LVTDYYFASKEKLSMKKITLTLAAGTALLLALGWLNSSQARPGARQENNASDKYQVKIDNFSFEPTTLTVPVGTTVTWTNQDDVPHNVVSTEGKTLKSPVMDTDQKFSFTFAKAGTYSYFCGIHPKMTGKVVVQ
jgi:amicyanin